MLRGAAANVPVPAEETGPAAAVISVLCPETFGVRTIELVLLSSVEATGVATPLPASVVVAGEVRVISAAGATSGSDVGVGVGDGCAGPVGVLLGVGDGDGIGVGAVDEFGEEFGDGAGVGGGVVVGAGVLEGLGAGVGCGAGPESSGVWVHCSRDARSPP